MRKRTPPSSPNLLILPDGDGLYDRLLLIASPPITVTLAVQSCPCCSQSYLAVIAQSSSTPGDVRTAHNEFLDLIISGKTLCQWWHGAGSWGEGRTAVGYILRGCTLLRSTRCEGNRHVVILSPPKRVLVQVTGILGYVPQIP